MLSWMIDTTSAIQSDGDIAESVTESTLRTFREVVQVENLKPYSMEELIIKYERSRELEKPMTCINSAAAVISMISSFTVIWIIHRSHVGLSSTYHRLLLGLCISDIILSLSMSFLGIWIPSELNYYRWSAIGNATTCTIQGFFFVLGTCMGTGYTCSLNLYYLAIIKYERSDKYIRKKIEPFLHRTAIIVPFVLSSMCFFNGNFNDHGGAACVTPVYRLPPHCIGYENGEIRDGFTIPCNPNDGSGGLWFFYIGLILASACPPLIIGGSLFLIYRSVAKIEKKMSKYGVGLLKIDRVPRQQAKESADTPSQGTNGDETVEMKVICSSTRKFANQKSKSKLAQSKSRMVMSKAIAYSISYFLTWAFVAIFLFQEFIAAKREVSLAIKYLAAVFLPLQGFYNLIILMFPRILAIKNKSKRKKVTWRQAIVKAFWSRGAGKSSESRRDSSTKASVADRSGRLPRSSGSKHEFSNNIVPSSAQGEEVSHNDV